MSKNNLLVAVVALAHLTCAGVPLTAPSGSTITINANPLFVAANGGTSSITAIVVEPAGTFVPDGTVVFFLTDLGRIEPQVKTKDGFAFTTFIADSRSGTAHVQAFSGGSGPSPAPSTSPSPAGVGMAGAADVTAASGSQPAAAGPPVVAAGAISAMVPITVGSANPAHIIVTADPKRITEPRNTALTANVADEVGNPVANVPVIFRIAAVANGLLQESLDSGGQPRFTDTNGQAHDTLRTSQNRADPQKQVGVVATLPTELESIPVVIFIN